MTKILTIANQKGGVGKTTTAVNLACALQLCGKKVLLLDMDAQGNATTSLGFAKTQMQWTMADVLLQECTLEQAIVPSSSGVFVVGANRDLAGLDVALVGQSEPTDRLKNALMAANLDYDYVLIDCAPSLSLVTVNALVATDGVIIPMQCEYYALEGVADLIYTLERLKEKNPNLSIKGVVRTLYDGRSTLVQEVSSELEQYFGDKLFKTTIPRTIRLAEAPSFGQSIFEHGRSSKGAIAYQKLAQELLERDTQQPLF